MSWVQTNCGFGFRGFKHTWIWMPIFFQQKSFFQTILPHMLTCCVMPCRASTEIFVQEVNPEFMAVLPSSIQEEVLTYHRLEQQGLVVQVWCKLQNRWSGFHFFCVTLNCFALNCHCHCPLPTATATATASNWVPLGTFLGLYFC